MIAASGFHEGSGLKEVAGSLRRAEYNPEVSPGLVLRLKRDGSPTLLLFTQGDGVCVGGKSRKEIGGAVDRIEKATQ